MKQNPNDYIEVIRKEGGQDKVIRYDYGHEFEYEPGPAFQFYPSDFLGSLKTARMKAQDVGAYMLLLMYMWGERDCGIDADWDALEVIGRVPEGWFNGGSTVVAKCFVEVGGRLYNPRLFKLRCESEEWRIKSSRAGVKSGKARRRKKLGQVNQRSTNDEPNANSPSPSPTPSPDIKITDPATPENKPVDIEAEYEQHLKDLNRVRVGMVNDWILKQFPVDSNVEGIKDASKVSRNRPAHIQVSKRLWIPCMPIEYLSDDNLDSLIVEMTNKGKPAAVAKYIIEALHGIYSENKNAWEESDVGGGTVLEMFT